MSAATRGSDLRDHDAPGEGEERAPRRHLAPQRDGAGSRESVVSPAVRHRRAVGALRQLGAPDAVWVVSADYKYMQPGSALQNAPAPVSPRQVRHRGGDANPSAEALRARFADAVGRVD